MDTLIKVIPLQYVVVAFLVVIFVPWFYSIYKGFRTGIFDFAFTKWGGPIDKNIHPKFFYLCLVFFTIIGVALFLIVAFAAYFHFRNTSL